MSIPFALWTLVGTLFADTLLGTLYPPEYVGNTLVVFLLLLRNLVESASAPVTYALQTAGQARHTSLALLFGVAFALVLAPVLVYQFGIVGAGVAMLLSALSISALKWYWMMRVEVSSAT